MRRKAQQTKAQQGAAKDRMPSTEQSSALSVSLYDDATEEPVDHLRQRTSLQRSVLKSLWKNLDLI